MPKQIRVSDETLDLMKKYGRAFESPDDCLKRILSDNPCKTKNIKESKIEEPEEQEQEEPEE